MEITYTDDKGESVEIINHYIEIPSYIKEFDEQKSFLNIKSEDVAMLFHSNKPMSKAVTIGRYQMFLKMVPDMRQEVSQEIKYLMRITVEMSLEQES